MSQLPNSGFGQFAFDSEGNPTGGFGGDVFQQGGSQFNDPFANFGGLDFLEDLLTKDLDGSLLGGSPSEQRVQDNNARRQERAANLATRGDLLQSIFGNQTQLQQALLGDAFNRTQLGENARQFDVGESGRLQEFLEAQRQFDTTQQLEQSEFDESRRQFDTRSGFLGDILGTLGFQEGGASGGVGCLLGGGPSDGFAELLAERRQVADQLLGDVANFGAGQRARLNSQFDIASNNATAALDARGLGGSNLVGSSIGAIEDARGQATLDLEDQLLGRRLDLAQQQFGGIFDTQSAEIDRQLQRQLQGIQTGGQIAAGLF